MASQENLYSRLNSANTNRSRNARPIFCVDDRVPFSVSACYSFRGITILFLIQRSVTMEWTTPQHEEIDLNCEISSYANAEL